MRQPKLLHHTREEFMHCRSNGIWKIYKLDSIVKEVFFLIFILTLIAAISGCAGKGGPEVGGSQLDLSKIHVYSSNVNEKIKNRSRNYEKGKTHKALVGEPLVSKIEGYVQKYKTLTKTHAGQYITKRGKEYEIGYENVEDKGFYIHVDCQGNYSDCGVGYYKIDKNGAILSRHPYYDYYGDWYVVNDLSIKNDSNQTVKKGTKIFEPLVSIAYSEDAYRMEIIYSGVDGNNLNLKYKKYISDFKTASSQQQLSYTLNKNNNIVTFRNFEIKIKEATNQYVKYIVLSD